MGINLQLRLPNQYFRQQTFYRHTPEVAVVLFGGFSIAYFYVPLVGGGQDSAANAFIFVNNWVMEWDVCAVA
jgi:hypothetical protein